VVTPEEREDIINAAVERTLLMIPDTVGNLMANHAALHKLNTAFYTAHPEFRGKKDIVQSVVEMVEGKNPIMNYEEILDKSVPEIQHRILAIADLNMTTAGTKLPTDFSEVDISENGKL